MIAAGFSCLARRSVSDALILLGNLGSEAKRFAGGRSRLPMMKLRSTEPSHLIGLGKIADLPSSAQVGGEIRLGGITTEDELPGSQLLGCKLLCDKVPLLVEDAGWVADPQVHSKGTIDGDDTHGDPADDQPALMVEVDASFVLARPAGERVAEADGFYLGLFTRPLAPDEIMTQIRISLSAAASAGPQAGR